jgi:hypothetical protein
MAMAQPLFFQQGQQPLEIIVRKEIDLQSTSTALLEQPHFRAQRPL